MSPTARQACLRPEFAHLYPGVEPGVWEIAGNLAERMLVRRRLAESGGDGVAGPMGAGGRILPDEHFSFRGGTASDRARGSERTRAGDPVAG